MNASTTARIIELEKIISERTSADPKLVKRE